MIVCGEKRFDLQSRCHIMGVLNVTHDSFSDGGLFLGPESAMAQGIQLFEDGADVVDIGGESTNWFTSQPLSVEQEIERVLPVVRGLVKRGFRALSIDTRNAETARVCLLEGASWVNDISGFVYDPQMIVEAKKADAVVLMHSPDIPQRMQLNPVYEDVVGEVRGFLASQIQKCETHGISKDRIIVDPGICFGKKLEHNLALLRRLDALQGLAAGVLVGVSRKSLLRDLTGIEKPADREYASLGAHAYCSLMGAQMVRVHNVRAHREMLATFESLRGARNCHI